MLKYFLFFSVHLKCLLLFPHYRCHCCSFSSEMCKCCINNHLKINLKKKSIQTKKFVFFIVNLLLAVIRNFFHFFDFSFVFKPQNFVSNKTDKIVYETLIAKHSFLFNVKHKTIVLGDQSNNFHYKLLNFPDVYLSFVFFFIILFFFIIVVAFSCFKVIKA